MKYIKLFESISEIEVAELCEKYRIRNWTLRPDGLVDVHGDVDLSYRDLTKLPLHFGKVSGYFNCHENELTTLEGAPTEVGGNFDCQFNKLTTLEGAPTEVLRDFYCHGNNLATLEGAPKEVGANFECYNNNLTTLKGGPKEVGGSFICHRNSLTTLKWAPEYVGRGVIFLPNRNLPKELLEFIKSSDYTMQKYMFEWQKDYAVWRKDGSFNEANFIRMMEDAKDEL